MPAALSLAYAADTAHGDEAESRAFIESNEMILDDETKGMKKNESQYSRK